MSSSLYSLGLTPAYTSNGNVNPWQVVQPQSDKTKQILDVVDKIEKIPDQLKARAKKWAEGEIKQLIKVARITLQNTPQNAHALNDIAQHIKKDAKDIAGGNDQGRYSPLPLQAPDTSGSEVDISGTEVQTINAVTITNGPDGISIEFDSFKQTTKIQASVSSQVASDANDADLLTQVKGAIGALKAALEKLKNGHGDHGALQAISGAANDVAHALDSVLNDAVSALESGGVNVVA